MGRWGRVGGASSLVDADDLEGLRRTRNCEYMFGNSSEPPCGEVIQSTIVRWLVMQISNLEFPQSRRLPLGSYLVVPYLGRHEGRM